ncbi:MAG TPA: hypothetical protein VKA88_04460 [Solirubrobacterales bacterium]|nr:hypothetical protein [Solirubrobacterales bacterium]
MWRWLRALPLGTQLYFVLWTVLVPTGVALLVAGATVPRLVLLVLFLFDQAVSHRCWRLAPRTGIGRAAAAKSAGDARPFRPG